MKLFTLVVINANEIHTKDSNEDPSWKSRLSATGRQYGFTHALATEEMGAQYLVDFEGPTDPFASHRYNSESTHILTLIQLQSS
jgi:hypothetical protein